MARPDRAQQMREARELFQFALRENIDMDEAKKRLAAEQWKAAQARLADKRCGTAAAPIAEDGKTAERPLPFWQTGQYA